MAIRARIKSKIKSFLFGSSTSTKSTVATSPPPKSPAFESPVVSTQATQTTKDKVEPAVSKVDSAKEDVSSASSNPATDDATVEENSSKALTEEDKNEAAFVIEITELFPATCPHCEVSTDNNWIRIENKFACGSCGTAY